MKNIAFILALLIAICSGCTSSTDEVSTKVAELMQNKFNTEQIAKLNIKVKKVITIHEEGNKYKGVATVEMDGKPHDITIKVIYDGQHIMYEADESQLSFISQKIIENSLTTNQENTETPLAKNKVDESTNKQNGILDQFDTNAHCKKVSEIAGGSYQIEETCRASENEAKNSLRSMSIPPEILEHCLRIGQVAGGSYEIALTCSNDEMKAKSKLDSQ